MKKLLPLLILACATAHAHPTAPSKVQPKKTTPITLNFNAIASTADGKTAPINCTDTYQLGSAGSAVSLADLRFYVSNVQILTKSGKSLPVALTQNDFQQSDVALIDLEDGTGNCANRGSGEVNRTLVGTIQGKYKPSELVGVAFEVGVPNAKNHSLFSSSDAPLNLQAMSWAWLSGRKFMKVELNVADKVHNVSDDSVAPLYNVHFGRTGCTGDVATGKIDCTQDNRIRVALTDKKWQQKTITLDLTALFAQTNLRQNQTGAVGCMSAPADTDCVGLFKMAGLAGESQRIFYLMDK